MLVMSRTSAAVLILLVLGGAGLTADLPEKLTVPPRPVEGFKLPPGAIVVVSSNPRDALSRVDAIVLTPEEYKKLLDTIDQLRKQANPDKPEVPSKCRLSARVETTGQQDVVKVHATFEFFTSVPKTTMALGCRNAGAVGATLDDGKLPSLQSADDGYSVVVGTPGPHELTLDLELPLTSRGVKGGERGFTLHLPGSPITLIDKVELPAGIASARLGRLLPAATPTPTPQTFAAPALLSPAANQPALALGPVDGLEVFWDVANPQKPADPLLLATGEIGVRVEESTVTTTARLSVAQPHWPRHGMEAAGATGSEVTVDAAAAADWDVVPGEDKSAWSVRALGPGRNRCAWKC